MTHVPHLPALLVLVAVVGLVVLGLMTLFRKKRVSPSVSDPTETLRIQERLASSSISRRASGSRRKVVAIRPPSNEEPVTTTDTEKIPVADSPSRHESPAEDASGH